MTSINMSDPKFESVAEVYNLNEDSPTVDAQETCLCGLELSEFLSFAIPAHPPWK